MYFSITKFSYPAHLLLKSVLCNMKLGLNVELNGLVDIFQIKTNYR